MQKNESTPPPPFYPISRLRFVFKVMHEMFGSGIVSMVSALDSTFNKNFDDTKVSGIMTDVFVTCQV